MIGFEYVARFHKRVELFSMPPFIRVLLPLVLANSFLCSFPANVNAQGEPEKLQRGDEFTVFRDTQGTLQNGDKRLLRRGKRCRTIDPAGAQLTALVDGAKLKIDRNDIVFGRSGIRRVTDEINRNPGDWTLRLIRADLYGEAKNITAALADIDAVPKDAPQFPYALFLRAMLEWQRDNWKQMAEDLRECRRLYEAEGKDNKETLASIAAWLGMALCKLESYPEALKELDAAIAGGADTVSSHSWRAASLWSMERFDDAILAFRRAAEIDPDDEDVRRRLIECIARVSGTESALVEANRYIEHAPKEPHPLAVRAMLYVNANQLDEAIADAERALELDPKNVDAYFIKAKALYNGEEWEQLAAICDELKELSLTSAAHFAARAMYFQMSQRLDEALPDADKAIELGTRDARVFLVRAQIYESRKDWKRVIADATEAINIDPQNARAFAWRYAGYVWTNELELALADINQAIALESRESTYYTFRGQLLYRLDQSDAALADLRTAAEVADKDSEAQSLLARALFGHKRYEECIVVLSEQIAQDGDDPMHYVARASAWQKRNNARMAIADLSEALRIKPSDALMLTMRASSNFEAEEIEWAVADLASAERAGPLSINGLYVRGKIHEYRGEYAEAIRTFEYILARDAKSPYGNAGLARVLATAADDSVRDGRKAIEYAAEACLATRYSDAGPVTFLAAAHAETGDFKAAVDWQTTAIGLADEIDRSKLAEQLELYKSQKPFRHTPKPAATTKVQ
jgi:tetratricopeptide (TPR) repeat protein